MERINWEELTETASNKLYKMLEGVENHQQPVARKYGSGYQVDTIGKSEQAEKSAGAAGWKLVR